MLNALVTDANAGATPVVGIAPHSASSEPRVAGRDAQNARLAFPADQAQLGLFSVGDLVTLFGGILIVAICLGRILKTEGSLNCKRLGWNLRGDVG